MTSIGMSQSVTGTMETDRLRPVRIWLYLITLLVLIMVGLGGYTRLSGSGLSIMEWKPVSGVIPPLSASDWQAEFDNYRQIPQFANVNPTMTVDGFKVVFWPEWSHRLLGRLIGFAFAVPFIIFLLQRRFSWNLAAPLALLWVAGGLQGVVGWWMVASGFEEQDAVSQYRLAAHLCAALILFLALIWVARSLIPKVADPAARRTKRWPVVVLLALVCVQIAAGAFVAGLHAGLSYNTWPLMAGTFIPGGLGALQPLWRNLFESNLTAQFDHRMIAYLVVLLVAFLLWRQSRQGGYGGANRWLWGIAGVLLVQFVLGIATLLSVVEIDLAVAHQVVAFLLAGSIMAYIADLSRQR